MSGLMIMGSKNLENPSGILTLTTARCPPSRIIGMGVTHRKPLRSNTKGLQKMHPPNNLHINSTPHNPGGVPLYLSSPVSLSDTYKNPLQATAHRGSFQVTA